MGKKKIQSKKSINLKLLDYGSSFLKREIVANLETE